MGEHETESQLTPELLAQMEDDLVSFARVASLLNVNEAAIIDIAESKSPKLTSDDKDLCQVAKLSEVSHL